MNFGLNTDRLHSLSLALTSRHSLTDAFHFTIYDYYLRYSQD